MATRFIDSGQCQVSVSNNFDTHGTVTKSTIAHLTPTDLETLFKPGGLFADMDAWFKTQLEMQACGTKINGMYEWLMSSQKNVKSLLHVEPMDRGPGLLYPFIKARQDSVINSEYWVITQGQANSAYTAGVTGPLTAADKLLGVAGDRVIRIITRYGIDMNAEFFNSRDIINIFNVGGNGASQRGQWKVLASEAEAATPPTYVDVLITSQNTGSATPWNSAPIAGLVLHGINNVNDYESFCANRPTLDPRKVVPFWYQTRRRIRSVDSQYKEVYARLMESNEYFRQFGDLPLAERNRQDEEMYQKDFVNSFFWNKSISSNQTLALWQSLEQINTATATIDVGLGGKIVGRRANFIGVYEQLRSCGQVSDLQNNVLNFYEWLDENYRLYRSRKSQGKSVTDIDWFTDMQYSAQMQTAYVAYIKNEYGDILRSPVTDGQNALGFKWTTLKPKFPSGININLVTHEFFDDLVNAAVNESIGSAGRFLMALEIGAPGPRGGSIYPGHIASNKKMRLVGENDNLAKIDRVIACTLEGITEEISLTSDTDTVIVECPSSNRIMEGVNGEVPVTTGRSGGTAASYLNFY